MHFFLMVCSQFFSCLLFWTIKKLIQWKEVLVKCPVPQVLNDDTGVLRSTDYGFQCLAL
jgi:hypothetical protein